jgi:quercetin dioxygenase-like cupin family protein
MPFYSLGELKQRELLPGIKQWVLGGEKGMISVLHFEPHIEVPHHHHPHEQLGTVLEGELELTIDNQTKIIGPGEYYLIPGNVPHSARSLKQDVLALDVFAPPREDYQ